MGISPVRSCFFGNLRGKMRSDSLSLPFASERKRGLGQRPKSQAKRPESIAPNAHTCEHSPQPVQSELSIATFPSLITIPGQPSDFMQRLQFVHLSASMTAGFSGFMITAHGDLNMIAFTPFSADTLFTVSTAALRSSGFTVSTVFIPMPRSTASMFTLSTT